MGVRKLLASFVILSGVAAGSVEQAGARLEQASAHVPAALRIEFRMRAAQTLIERHPDLARKFIGLAVEEIRSGKDWRLGNAVLQAFAVAAPSEGIAILPFLSGDQTTGMIGALARADRTADAAALYRQSLAPGKLLATAANGVLVKLVKEKPAEAAKLFQEMLAAADFQTLDPFETFRFLDCARTVAPVAPEAANTAYARIAKAASAENYGANSQTVISATFQGGPEPITTTNWRDTILTASRNRQLRLKSASFRNANAAPPKMDGPDAAISKQMSGLRGLPTDADRARSVIQIAHAIRELPAAAQARWASSLANLSTEGDLGKGALGAVADTLSQALLEAPATTCDAYIELASLVRFEHLPAPKPDPSVDAADALIALQEQLHQEAGFTLTSLDGKTYSLAELRGKVVLLNFWATWCPPCRKEMPDMEKLYRRFQAKGLIVLAVSDEDRETVAGFQQKQRYTFPLVLDPDRKVNTLFNVEGIPKSFLFDREGKLVAQAIDMRTESQFLEMLKRAGISD